MNSNNISLLCYEGKSKDNKAQNNWLLIFNEYLKDFGLPEQYERYLKAMKRVINMYKIAYVDGKRTYITKAKILEMKTQAEFNSQENTTFGVTLAQVSKSMGFQVNQKDTTVREFYSYIALLSDK